MTVLYYFTSFHLGQLYLVNALRAIKIQSLFMFYVEQNHEFNVYCYSSGPFFLFSSRWNYYLVYVLQHSYADFLDLAAAARVLFRITLSCFPLFD